MARGGLLGCTGVDNSDAAIVSSEGKSVTAGREGHTLDPTSGVVQEFTTDGVERQTLTPSAGLGSGVDTFDEAGEHTGMGVGRSSGQKNGVRVPRKGCDCAADRLLQVLRDPPVVLLLEVTDSNHSSTGTDGKLLFRRRPAHKGCSAINSEKDQSGLPAGGSLLPDVGITVCWASVSIVRVVIRINRSRQTLRAGHNSTTVGSNINTSDGLLVAFEFIAQRELVA